MRSNWQISVNFSSSRAYEDLVSAIDMTTAFQALARELNAKGEIAALYLTVEDVQEFTDPREVLPQIVAQIRMALDAYPGG